MPMKIMHGGEREKKMRWRKNMIALCSDPDLNVFRWLPCWLQSDHFLF